MEKRKILRQLSIKDEIKNYVDIITDDVWDKIKEIYKDSKYNIIREIVDVEDINFYNTIKSLLIDGYLAYEVIFNDNKDRILDLKPLDPINMVANLDTDGKGMTWIQYPDIENKRKVLYDYQVLYFSYSCNDVYHHTSYVEQLKESYEKFKMAESAHLYESVNSGKKNIDLESVKWLEKNMNRISRIPEDKLDTGLFQHYIDKSNIKYDKFLKRISDIFKINMFDKLIELKEKIKK